MNLDQELTIATQAARAAAVLVRDAVAAGNRVQMKGENDPVTDADLAANACIVAALSRAFASDAIITEETDDEQPRARRTWFVDPVDGTRELVRGIPEYCTMIGLAVDGVARLGVIETPFETYGAIVGVGAWRERGGVREPIRVSSEAGLRRLLTSRSRRHPMHAELRRALGDPEQQAVGSVGVKCVRIASAMAEAYVEPYGQTHAWDTCAPQAILEAAGGRMTDLRGGALLYVDRALNRCGVLATNGHCHAQALLELEPLLEALIGPMAER